MTELMLATADTDFEQRVRTAFKGRFDGQLRYWREGLLDEQAARMIEELGHRGAEVVAIGPGIATDRTLEFARAIDHDRPDVSTVIVAEPSNDLLQAALHAGARDVIAPGATNNELRACVRARPRRRQDATQRIRRRGRDGRRDTCHPVDVPEGRRREDHHGDEPRAGARPARTGRRGDRRPGPAVR